MKSVIAMIGMALMLASQSPAMAKDAEKPDLTVSIGTWSLGYLPLPIAQAESFFKDQGLNVNIQNFNAGGSTALRALLGGSTDAVLGFYEHTINMQAENKSIRCLIQLNTLPGNVVGVREDLKDQIKSPADLKGHLVGVTALGSGTEFMLRSLTTKAGLGPDDVNMVAIGTGPSSIAAVEHKSVDAVVTADPAATVLESRGLLHVLIDGRTVDGTKQTYGGIYPTICLYSTEDFITKNPETVQRLVNAFAKALVWIHDTDAKDIVAALPSEYIIGDKDQFTLMIDKSKQMFPQDGHFNLPDLERVHDVISQFSPAVRNAKIDMDKTYTNQFVDAVPKQ